MSTEENKTIVRNWYDTHQPGRLDEGEAMVTDDFTAYGLGPTAVNRDGFKQAGAMFVTAFSDIEQRFDDQVAEGDKVASRGTWAGTHTGDFQGIPPTGRRITMSWMGIDHIRDGKIAMHWAQLDILGLMHQLGVIPEPEHASA